jgi:hypothetical protein
VSDLAIFAVGIIIFAVTVYGTVMAGGLVLTKRQLDDNDTYVPAGDDDRSGLPLKVKY